MHWKAVTPPFRPVPQTKQLISKLRCQIRHEPTRLRNPSGPPGRLRRFRKIVTDLIKYERLEMNAVPAREARGYAERLISEAVRYGDTHKPTMELADFWINEKQLVHKLFKVLVPRFKNYKESYTQTFNAPARLFNSLEFQQLILELKENPYPPVIVDKVSTDNHLHNILLRYAKLDYHMTKNKTGALVSDEGSDSDENKTSGLEKSTSVDKEQQSHTVNVDNLSKSLENNLKL